MNMCFFLKLFGMSFFDKKTHSMTTIATGVFQTTIKIGYF